MTIVQREQLAAEWERLAPAWIRQTREGLNLDRTAQLDAPMLAACGGLQGYRVLDSGCGEGRFCRMMLERDAAYALGIDLCPPMIDAAQQLASGRDEYRVADAQDLGFLPDGSFDLAVSYLNQCDLPDFPANTREIFRVLRNGGRFIVANLHPMRSAVGAWQKTPAGEKQHVILDRYLEEGARRWTMLGVEFTNFHRTLSTYVRGFIGAGFRIDDIAEPTVAAETAARHPGMADELRVPNFIIFALAKPA
jgi:SAM-dependent methyltransferase